MRSDASDHADAFGRQLVSARVAEAAELETDAGRASRFAQADHILGHLITTVLAGADRVVEVTETRRETSLRLAPLDDTALTYIRDTWAKERHERAGFWQLPEAIPLHHGLANLAYYQRIQPAFFSVAAFSEHTKVIAGEHLEAIYLWAQVEPLLELLFAPLRLRGPGIIQKSDTRVRDWAEFETFAEGVGLELSPVYRSMRSGERWLGLSRDEQIAAKAAFLELLRGQIPAESGTLLRAAMMRPLVERYYRRARDGRALRKTVLTRDLQRVLSAYFAGDWLAFLDYLGEQSHPEEELVGALPESRIITATTTKAAEVAAATGVSPDEVSAIVAAFWGDQHTASPPDRRIEALKRLWAEFDRLHAQQRPGMPSLDGLVTGHPTMTFPVVDHGPYYPSTNDAYRLLPPASTTEIRELWGTTTLPRYPDRIVSEAYPINAATRAFGPALQVWHALAMAAWRACEAIIGDDDEDEDGHEVGVSLRNVDFDIYRDLQHTDTPIDRAVLDEMRAALPRLGKPVSIDEHTTHTTKEIASGVDIGFSVTMSGGMMRRDGFEILRDIVTRHRRAWAAAYLDRYLNDCWPTELREVAEGYNRLTLEKGKPPTAKQFARLAESSANDWFGGDLAAVYAAIGAKSPIRTERVSLMPEDRVAFAWAVFTELGGQKIMPKTPDDHAWNNYVPYHALEKLAGGALRYVQLEEALGRAPELSEYGRWNFATPGEQGIDKDLDRAWARFGEAVHAALAKTPMLPPRPVVPDTPNLAPALTLPTRRSDPPPEQQQKGLWSRLFDR